MSWIPDDTILKQLKCSTCRNYISVGPVAQSSDGYNCGRCSANGNEINTFFEIFVKNSIFPCRYDVNGCSAKMAYGEEVINHEEICEYRPGSCPVVDNCEWSGPTITSFDHCLKKHNECIVESNEFEFKINLRESVNKKSVMKRKNGEVLLLHTLYNEEKGFSVNIQLLILKNKKKVFRYSLILQSSDEKNRMELESREVLPFYCVKPSLEWIPFHTLSCLDKTEISILIQIERNHSAALPNECDNCDQTLPLYILQCSENHRFCNNCRNIQEKCIFCFNNCLKISSNYSAMETERGIFGCCHAVYGCSFLGNLARLQEHEEKCSLLVCPLCMWKGVECKFSDHVLTHDIFTDSQINITLKDIDDNGNTYFFVLSASCNQQYHSHQRGVVAVKIKVDDTKNIIKLVANYVTSPIGATFCRGDMEVNVGNTIYRCSIGQMTDSVTDQSGEIIHFCRWLLKENEVLTIQLNCTLSCI